MSRPAAQPKWVVALLDTSLTPMERVLLVILARHQGRNDYAWPSHAQLANELGTSRGTVKHLLRDLVKKGRLTVEHPERQGRTRVNRYVVHPTKGVVKGVVGGPPSSTKKGVAGAHERGSRRARLTGRNKEEEVKKKSCVGAHTPSFPPTVEEVRAYAEGIGYASLDAARFCDYYAANGWRVGQTPMRDWRAAVRNWQRRDAEGNGKPRREPQRGDFEWTPTLEDLADIEGQEQEGAA